MTDFTFEQTPWEATRDTLRPGDSISAVRFLAMLEGEEEETLEDALQDLEDLHVTLDISDLPASFGSGDLALRLKREAKLVQTNGLLTDLEETDPLRLYLEELAGVPACGDAQVLAMECAAGNERAREALVNVSLSRVVAIAEEQVGRGVLLLDLIQEGSQGLWQGILNYSEGDFEAHRDWWIRQYISKTIVLQARASGVGQKMRQAAEDYRAVDERLLTELGRNPTLEEIAQELHMTPEEARSVEKTLQSARVVNKAQEPEKEEDPDDERHVEDTAYFQSRQRIMEMLSGLSDREAQLLTLRFGLEGGLPLNPAEAGAKLGLTSEEVVAMEAAALAKLRQS